MTTFACVKKIHSNKLTASALMLAEKIVYLLKKAEETQEKAVVDFIDHLIGQMKTLIYQGADHIKISKFFKKHTVVREY